MYAVKHSMRQLHDDALRSTPFLVQLPFFYQFRIVTLIFYSFSRRQALMEVQSLAALGYSFIIFVIIDFHFFIVIESKISCTGFHENIVGYHTSWFENEKLYIQMELCDHSLSFSKSHILPKEEIFEVLYQVNETNI